ncbi:MAG: hypothetical protein WCG04_03845, partial [Alphaproteobacteria bacterium]
MKSFFVVLACLFSMLDAASASSRSARAELDPAAEVAAHQKREAIRLANQVLAEERAIINQQAELKIKIERDYDMYSRNIARFAPDAGSNDVVRYLDHLTRVQTFIGMPGAADGVNNEILAILRGALVGLPSLESPLISARDREVIIKAFLATQITKDLDTEWYGGGYKKEDPRYEIEEPRLQKLMGASYSQSPRQFDILKG